MTAVERTLTTWRKCEAYARIGRRELRSAPAELYGSMAFLLLIVGIFSQLWRAAAEFGLPSGRSAEQLVWYLAATEWLLLSLPGIHFQMAEEIRRGDAAYALSRPNSYLTACFARALGQLGLRAAALAPAAFVAGWLFTGTLPTRGWALLDVAAFGLAGASVATAFRVCLGLCAFWLQDVLPLHWIWQKLGFLLGGLMLPLDFLPPTLRRFAEYTPFPCSLYGPASALLDGGIARGRLASELLLWGTLALALGVGLFARARRNWELNGG